MTKFGSFENGREISSLRDERLVFIDPSKEGFFDNFQSVAKELEAVGKLLFDNAGSLEEESVLLEKTPALIRLYKEVAEEAEKRAIFLICWRSSCEINSRIRFSLCPKGFASKPTTSKSTTSWTSNSSGVNEFVWAVDAIFCATCSKFELLPIFTMATFIAITHLFFMVTRECELKMSFFSWHLNMQQQLQHRSAVM